MEYKALTQMSQISIHVKTIPSVYRAPSNLIPFIALQFNGLNHCPLICHLLLFLFESPNSQETKMHDLVFPEHFLLLITT